jgi:hypothetical protein
MKMDLKKSGGDFSSVNIFPPKLNCLLLDLSVLKNKEIKFTQKEFFQRYGLSGWIFWSRKNIQWYLLDLSVLANVRSAKV